MCKLQISRLYVRPITLYFLVFIECILFLSADLPMAADNGHCFHCGVGPPSLWLPAVQNHQDWWGQAVWRQARELPGLCWVLDFSGTTWLSLVCVTNGSYISGWVPTCSIVYIICSLFPSSFFFNFHFQFVLALYL